ncbi:MAG: ATP-dependent DNA helicase RecG [Thermoflexales bacterium]|nr:ATP-dependent DNA helicase RecG [Thermoflexales bacterium]
MANPATEKLLKILRLESQMGCLDKAVTRGLASFAQAWLADAGRSGIEPAFAEEVAESMRAYGGLSEPDARRPVLAALIQRLQGGPSAAPASNVPVRERPASAPGEDVANPRPVVGEPPPPRAQPAPTPTRAADAAARHQRPSETGLGLDAPVSRISGVGDATGERLEKLGVRTIRDLLYFFPARYDDYSALKTINQLEYGEQVTVLGRVFAVRKTPTRGSMRIVRVTIEDASGMIECVFFTTERFVDRMVRNFEVGREVVISGKVSEYLGRLVFQNPAYEPAERDWITGGNVVPVYHLTEGLQPLLLRRIMRRMAEYWPTRVPDPLPDGVRRAVGVMSLGDALREIHWPRDLRAAENARRRLAFDELFTMQVAIQRQRALWRATPATPLQVGEPTLDRLIAALPYTLTGAQRRAIGELFQDLRRPFAMHRLLQGDVGSGKTAVAAVCMALATSVGAQAALMAPTEILAEQHYNNLRTLFAQMSDKRAVPPITVRLLTGKAKASEKEAVYAQLADGTCQIVIGTHALIQEGVRFNNLALIVVDEQHRFGVEQRKTLREKGTTSAGTNPHTLVMTATPIPRTLALTMYGDLDYAVLDEMPPGRKPISTHWFTPAERERAYAFIRAQVAEGRQAFIICPLVEESDKVEARAAVEEHARLQAEIFPDLRLALLHGRMKPSEKEAVMAGFSAGDSHILVSTSVVEVGIDVPNASVMMIEGANRFGLSQLHQFRGRVGRGAHASYCLLLSDASSDVSDERLQAIVDTQDGFKLAERDLELRGMGEFFGKRQSGDPEFKLVRPNDRDLLLRAREQAERLNELDPELAAPEHTALRDQIATFWARRVTAGDAS